MKTTGRFNQLPAPIRAMILAGKGEWSFRARQARCCFEYAFVRAATPKEAMHRARATPVRERTRRFVTTGEDPYALEVFFEGQWFEIDPYADAAGEERILEQAISALRARADPVPVGAICAAANTPAAG
ncbi:MAG: hypothetical protein LBC18_14860 [Opitutaceae bacterium]|jgi:hypothetical protein|nr:hypothetical protein [Opitutaceae bacterium]